MSFGILYISFNNEFTHKVKNFLTHCPTHTHTNTHTGTHTHISTYIFICPVIWNSDV